MVKLFYSMGMLPAGKTPIGPVVKRIQHHLQCAELLEGDVLLEVNGESTKNYPRLKDLAKKLNQCPEDNLISFLIFRLQLHENKV